MYQTDIICCLACDACDPSWRWMGGFHFMLAFHFHRPQAGAGWAASASCWHSASTDPELSLDGWLPLPVGILLPPPPS